MVHICRPSIWEIEAGGSEFPDHLWLYREFEVRMSHIHIRPCLKKEKEEKRREYRRDMSGFYANTMLLYIRTRVCQDSMQSVGVLESTFGETEEQLCLVMPMGVCAKAWRYHVQAKVQSIQLCEVVLGSCHIGILQTPLCMPLRIFLCLCHISYKAWVMEGVILRKAFPNTTSYQLVGDLGLTPPSLAPGS